MNHIKEMRLSIGLSQQHLAAWLHVGRTLLSMAELGTRDLPVAARIQLYQMAGLVSQAATPNTAGEPTTTGKKDTANALKKYAAKCRRRADALTKKLTAIEERHALANKLLHNLGLLKTLLAEGPELKRQTLILELAGQEATAALQKPGSLQLALLQLKIAGLVAEATRALELANELLADAG